MCSPVVVDFFFHAWESLKNKWNIWVIHFRSLFLIYWGYNAGLSKVKRSFASDLGETKIFLSSLQIGIDTMLALSYIYQEWEFCGVLLQRGVTPGVLCQAITFVHS